MFRIYRAYTKERCVVVDKVLDHTDFLRVLPARLEQAGGEDGGQFLTRHLVEVGTLLDSGRRTEKQRRT